MRTKRHHGDRAGRYRPMWDTTLCTQRDRETMPKPRGSASRETSTAKAPFPDKRDYTCGKAWPNGLGITVETAKRMSAYSHAMANISRRSNWPERKRHRKQTGAESMSLSKLLAPHGQLMLTFPSRQALCTTHYTSESEAPRKDGEVDAQKRFSLRAVAV